MLTAGEVILRSLVIYVAMLTLARIMGKREMARMSYFDWVVGITIGSLAAATVFDPAFPVRLGLLALAVWGGMEVLVSLGALKYRGFRKLLEGGPTPVVRHGRVLARNLGRLRINQSELASLLRERKVTRLADVELATIEPSGKLGLKLRDRSRAEESEPSVPDPRAALAGLRRALAEAGPADTALRAALDRWLAEGEDLLARADRR